MTNIVNVITFSQVSSSNNTVFSINDEKSLLLLILSNCTCTFRMLQVDLLPYMHALAIITNTKRDLYASCFYYYTRDAHINVYQDSKYPVENPIEWTMPQEVQYQIVLASNQKKSPRRLTEKRKRSSSKRKTNSEMWML